MLNPIIDFVRGDTRKQSNRYSKSLNKSNVPLSSNSKQLRASQKDQFKNLNNQFQQQYRVQKYQQHDFLLPKQTYGQSNQQYKKFQIENGEEVIITQRIQMRDSQILDILINEANGNLQENQDFDSPLKNEQDSFNIQTMTKIEEEDQVPKLSIAKKFQQARIKLQTFQVVSQVFNNQNDIESMPILDDANSFLNLEQAPPPQNIKESIRMSVQAPKVQRSKRFATQTTEIDEESEVGSAKDISHQTKVEKLLNYAKHKGKQLVNIIGLLLIVCLLSYIKLTYNKRGEIKQGIDDDL
ncbi:hypothetical protein pb186bvf_004440 [Paramecium bursaria]